MNMIAKFRNLVGLEVSVLQFALVLYVAFPYFSEVVKPNRYRNTPLLLFKLVLFIITLFLAAPTFATSLVDFFLKN